MKDTFLCRRNKQRGKKKTWHVPAVYRFGFGFGHPPPESPPLPILPTCREPNPNSPRCDVGRPKVRATSASIAFDHTEDMPCRASSTKLSLPRPLAPLPIPLSLSGASRTSEEREVFLSLLLQQ